MSEDKLVKCNKTYKCELGCEHKYPHLHRKVLCNTECSHFPNEKVECEIIESEVEGE